MEVITLFALIGFAFVVYVVYNAYVAVREDDRLETTVLHMGGLRVGYGNAHVYDTATNRKYGFVISGGKKRVVYFDDPKNIKTINYGG